LTFAKRDGLSQTETFQEFRSSLSRLSLDNHWYLVTHLRLQTLCYLIVRRRPSSDMHVNYWNQWSITYTVAWDMQLQWPLCSGRERDQYTERFARTWYW